MQGMLEISGEPNRSRHQDICYNIEQLEEGKVREVSRCERVKEY